MTLARTRNVTRTRKIPAGGSERRLPQGRVRQLPRCAGGLFEARTLEVVVDG